MRIIEITNDDSDLDKFLKLVKESYYNVNKLSKNYKSILETYDEYKTFIMLIDGDKPVAFCGLQEFYGNSIRTYTRYFLSKEYRFYNNRFLESSKYILPWSVKYAKDNNYGYLFASFQSNFYRERITNILCDNANKYTNVKWTKLKGLYNTCKNNEDKPECWQHIVRCTLKKDEKWNLISQKN